MAFPKTILRAGGVSGGRKSLLHPWLSAMYGTILTPYMVSKWSENEYGKCNLFEETIHHSLEE